MTNEFIKKYAGVLYEMGLEIESGREFTDVRRETAHWLKRFNEDAARKISFCSGYEFATAFNKVQPQQQQFDVFTSY